jgi:hypothetical protein
LTASALGWQEVGEVDKTGNVQHVVLFCFLVTLFEYSTESFIHPRLELTFADQSFYPIISVIHRANVRAV